MKIKDWLLDIIVTIVFFGLILMITSAFIYFSIIDSKNPSPKGAICSMKAKEQRLAYSRYFTMNKICEKQGLEFLSLNRFTKGNKKIMDERCNLDYCCYNIEISEKFYCKNKETHEMRGFIL